MALPDVVWARGHAYLMEQLAFAMAWVAGQAVLAALPYSQSHPVFPICPRGLWHDRLPLPAPPAKGCFNESGHTGICC